MSVLTAFNFPTLRTGTLPFSKLTQCTPLPRRFCHTSLIRYAQPVRSGPIQVQNTFAGAVNRSEAGPSIHPTKRPSLWRPSIFCGFVGFSGYMLAAQLTNEDTAKRVRQCESSKGVFSSRAVSAVDLAKSRLTELKQSLVSMVKSAIGKSPDPRGERQRAYILAAEWWLNKNEGQRTCIAIIAAQAVVFLAWRVAPGLMTTTFTHYPLSGRSYTLLTSVFSHRTTLHFLFNSIAFYGFGTSTYHYLHLAHERLNPDLLESTPRYHFIALFVAAGLAASWISHAYSLLWRLPRILRYGASVSPILPSLGASGAVYATIVVSALAFPEMSISLIILPFFSVPIGVGVGGIIALDILGLIRGWKVFGMAFDHAAHLGGAAVGLLAYMYTVPWFDDLRRSGVEVAPEYKDCIAK